MSKTDCRGCRGLGCPVPSLPEAPGPRAVSGLTEVTYVAEMLVFR